MMLDQGLHLEAMVMNEEEEEEEGPNTTPGWVEALDEEAELPPWPASAGAVSLEEHQASGASSITRIPRFFSPVTQ